MSVKVGFAQTDLMDILAEKRNCEMPVSGVAFHLAQNGRNSFFFTVDFMDFDLQTVNTLKNTLSKVLPEQTEIHILTTHNHGAGSCSDLDMERFCSHAAECAVQAVKNAAECKLRFASGPIDRDITFSRRIFVPEAEGSFTCFYGIDPEQPENASAFVKRALTALENDSLCFTGDGSAENCSSFRFKKADPFLAVLEFRTMDDIPLGNIVRFASHAVCCNLPDCYSSDYPGYLRKLMQEALGGVSLFWNGPCAEIAPAISAKSAGNGKKFAKILAKNALRMLNNSSFQPLAYFRDTAWQINMPVRGEVLTGKVIHSREPDTPAGKKKHLEYQRLNGIMPFLQGIYRNGEKSVQETIPVSAAMLELNDCNFLFFCGETFSKTAQEITGHFPEYSWITVTEHGRTAMYIPPAEEYLRGGYEFTCATVAKEAEQLLKEQLICLIKTAKTQNFPTTSGAVLND